MLHRAVEDFHVQTQEADRIRASLILKLSHLPSSLERELQTRGHFLSLSVSSFPTLFYCSWWPRGKCPLYIRLLYGKLMQRGNRASVPASAEHGSRFLSFLPSRGSALNGYEMCCVYLTPGTHTRWTFSPSGPFSLVVYGLRKWLDLPAFYFDP